MLEILLKLGVFLFFFFSVFKQSEVNVEIIRRRIKESVSVV